jgi:hypothetical protein
MRYEYEYEIREAICDTAAGDSIAACCLSKTWTQNYSCDGLKVGDANKFYLLCFCFSI